MPQREERQAATRESVLQAAIAVFAEHGYQGATMEQIARRAGVAKGTTYLHFGDKADLFYAVFERWTAEAMAGSVQGVAAAASARERLLALGLGAVDFMATHREWFPLSMEVWAASGSPALRERFAAALKALYADYRRETAAIIRAGQVAGELRPELDAEALAALLTGAVDGLFIQAWLDPDLDVRDLLIGFFDALSRGLIPTTNGDPS